MGILFGSAAVALAGVLLALFLSRAVKQTAASFNLGARVVDVEFWELPKLPE